jgi:predicted metalloprotease
MKWERLRRSSNIDDLRGRRIVRSAMPRGLRLRGGRGGLVVVIVLVAAYLVGGPEALDLLLGGGTGTMTETTPRSNSVADDEAARFVAAILGSTEDEWSALFERTGQQFVPPRLTLFSNAVESACGFSTSAVGPFYCPPDRRVYLDMSFFAELARMGGPGDFAQAYVVGHEVGHHVQNLLGTAAQVRNAQARSDEAGRNRLQVALELQADCFAGVWAHNANRRSAVLEAGDVEEGLAAAAAIGDDRLQRNAGRRVTPDSFTHGSSAARQKWLRLGLESGDPAACDTFGAL